MKILFSTLIIVLLGLNANAQTINWSTLQKDQTHIISVNTALDYGVNYGVGYSYQISSKLPILLNASFSLPSGRIIPDDFKT